MHAEYLFAFKYKSEEMRGSEVLSNDHRFHWCFVAASVPSQRLNQEWLLMSSKQSVDELDHMCAHLV